MQISRELRELVAVAMTPELRLLARSVLWTIYVLSQRKAECRRRLFRKIWLHDGCSHHEKAPQVRGYFFYIGRIGMPTKPKLMRGLIKVMRIKLPTVAVWNGPALIRITRMHIQCGRIQHELLRIIMSIVGLVWTGLNFHSSCTQ